LDGDFNNDLVVDSADYALWLNNLGATDESAINNNGDGINGVDLGDYLLWKASIGMSTATGNLAEVNVVPEPASLFMLSALGLAIATLTARRRSLAG